MGYSVTGMEFVWDWPRPAWWFLAAIVVIGLVIDAFRPRKHDNDKETDDES